MSAIYEKLGVRFMYPDTWEVIDEDPAADPRSISVHNKTGAFWSVTAYRAGIEPAEIAAAALSALRDEYEELEAEEVTEQIGPLDADGYDVHFYVQQLVAAARIRAFEYDSRTILLLCQGEDREFDQLARVFDAMTLSFIGATPSLSD